MKRIKNIALLLSSLYILCCLTSCQKDLEVIPQTNLTETSFWKTEEDAVNAINAVYEYIHSEAMANDGMFGRGYYWLQCVGDDMVFGRSRGSNYTNVQTFTGISGRENFIATIWKDGYRMIKICNDVLRNVPAIKISDKIKNQVLGEAYFLSGLSYFMLNMIYGPSPILDPLKPTEFNLPRPTDINQNYNYTIKLFEQAVEKLPYFDELSSENKGRAHKTAALAFLAKTYLYQKNWAKAEETAEKIRATGKHELIKNFVDVFKVDNNWSKEYIWSILGRAERTSASGNFFPSVMLETGMAGGYNGWNYYKPTKGLYDAFELGDIRREVSIMIPNEKYSMFGKEEVYTPQNNSLSSQLLFKKFFDPFFYKDNSRVSSNSDNPTTDLNFPFVRYAEVLLIIAEAKLMQGKNADAEINTIRQRAGLKNKTNCTMADLKKERRCELAGEMNFRHYDLVRWGDATTEYAKPLQAFNGNTIVAPRTNFNADIHKVFPIPATEIDKSYGTLIQNPGY